MNKHNLLVMEGWGPVFNKLNKDIEYIMENDPAARSKIEVFLLYPSIHAIIWHRVSHFLYKKKMFFTARLISQISRFITGIEICPMMKEKDFEESGLRADEIIVLGGKPDSNRYETLKEAAKLV